MRPAEIVSAWLACLVSVAVPRPLMVILSIRSHTVLESGVSSDVCSSDLLTMAEAATASALASTGASGTGLTVSEMVWIAERSEERRVGKEGRSRWSPYH